VNRSALTMTHVAVAPAGRAWAEGDQIGPIAEMLVCLEKKQSSWLDAGWTRRYTGNTGPITGWAREPVVAGA